MQGKPNGFITNRNTMIDIEKIKDAAGWIDAGKQTPAQWAKENHWGNGEGRHRVKLQDEREIYSWWQNGQWSVERLMPHLKVAYWKRPVIIG
jgi:hypothetical protein